jgi:hypothetical protein
MADWSIGQQRFRFTPELSAQGWILRAVCNDMAAEVARPGEAGSR